MCSQESRCVVVSWWWCWCSVSVCGLVCLAYDALRQLLEMTDATHDAVASRSDAQTSSAAVTAAGGPVTAGGHHRVDTGRRPASAVIYSALAELFQLFCDVVPAYHRQLIYTDPLHAGHPCNPTMHLRHTVDNYPDPLHAGHPCNPTMHHRHTTDNYPDPLHAGHPCNPTMHHRHTTRRSPMQPHHAS